MKYVIVGADRESGEDISITIEARDEAEARDKASRRGILVATCTGQSPPPPKPVPLQAVGNKNISKWWLLVIPGILVVGPAIGLLLPDSGSSSASRPPPPPRPNPLPYVRVVNGKTQQPDNSITFSNWHMNGPALHFQMLWTTDYLATIRM